MILPPSPYPFLASKPGHIGRVTLLGAPLDATGSFRPGTAEGPHGIRWASENLETYSPCLDRDLEELDLGDIGDLELTGLSQEDALRKITDEVGRLLDAGTLPLVLGGEHTIALGITRAVCARHPGALILHFDAHADLRAEYLGEPLSHATWAYRVGEAYGFERLIQLGIRSGLREEFILGRARSGHFTMGLDIPPGIRLLLQERPVYLSLDIDVLDSSNAPGTGTPEAGGATYKELMDCLYGLRGARIVAMDVNEVAPPLDPTGATSAIASKVVREMILAFGL
jgi:agmatinase